MNVGVDILLIADDESTRDSYLQVLVQGENRVKAVASPAEGMAQLNEDTFDLVIIDVKGSDTDSIATFAQIRQKDPKVSVLLAGPSILGKAPIPGMDTATCDFVITPFTPESLRFVVDLAMAKRRGNQGAMATTVSSLDGDGFFW